MNTKNGEKNSALIPRPSSAVEKFEPGARRILAGMIADTLAIANRSQFAISQAKFRIGDDEWCEPDYRQILRWAKTLSLKPEDVVARLLDKERLSVDEDGQRLLFPLFEPMITKGKLIKVNWDMQKLPFGSIEWIDGLEITHIRFLGVPKGQCLRDLGALPLLHLVWLSCVGLGLMTLDLSGVPQLQWLRCDGNRLHKLELDSVPELTSLNCHGNDIETLSFRNTRKLVRLNCGQNNIAQLDLSGPTGLQDVLCSQNELTELILSNLPALATLDCSHNGLPTLDLSLVPELTELDCSANEIEQLDLSRCRELRTLDCSGNRIAALDIRNLENLESLVYDERTTKLLKRPDQAV